MFDWWEILAIIGLAILIITGLYYCAKDEEDWQQFKIDHHCKIVAHIEGGLTPGIGSSLSGKLVVTSNFEPNKTGYLCDDGITYYRED